MSPGIFKELTNLTNQTATLRTPFYIFCFLKVLPSGLLISFLGGFEGTIDLLHLPECGGDGKNLDKNYPPKKKVHFKKMCTK